MTIQLTIADADGASLAKAFGVTVYADGNDLVTQCVAKAVLRDKRSQAIMGSALATRVSTLDAIIEASQTKAL